MRPPPRSRSRSARSSVVLLLVLTACVSAGTVTDRRTASISPTRSGSQTPLPAAVDPSPPPPPPKLEGFDNIEHLVFIVQENRSFDHYFGTFPGAEGIQMQEGRLAVCVPDPVLDACVRPFHDRTLVNVGRTAARTRSRT